eukprot:gene22435-29547_t
MKYLEDILPLLSPKQLADAMRTLAKQGFKPSTDKPAAIADEIKSKLGHIASQDLSNTVWALAVLKYNPDADWWDLFERQVYVHLTDFSGRELANLLWALPILEYRPSFILDSVMNQAVDGLDNDSASTLHLMASFFQFTPNEMSNIIWALAKLGRKLPLDNFLMVTLWRFPSFDAKLLSILFWSSAMQEHRPSQEWMLSFQQQIWERFEDFTGKELAALAWALRKFGYSREQSAVFHMLECQDRLVTLSLKRQAAALNLTAVGFVGYMRKCVTLKVTLSLKRQAAALDLTAVGFVGYMHKCVTLQVTLSLKRQAAALNLTAVGFVGYMRKCVTLKETSRPLKYNTIGKW